MFALFTTLQVSKRKSSSENQMKYATENAENKEIQKNYPIKDSA